MNSSGAVVRIEGLLRRSKKYYCMLGLRSPVEMSSNRVCVWVGEGSMGDEICFFEFFGVQIVTKWGGEGVFIGRWGTEFAFSDFLEFRQLKNS
jgi:hypothetical protein